MKDKLDNRISSSGSRGLFMPTRRELLAGGAAGILASQIGFARAATELNGVWWGGPWIEAIKGVAEKQSDVSINWQLHSGGSAAVIPKIQSAWPNYIYDVVGSFTPVYPTLINEGWCEPLTVEEIPNLVNVPEQLIFKNAQGQNMNVPMTLTGKFWGYRKDTCPIALEDLDQLLDPAMKGQLCWWGPTYGGNLHLVSLALHRGGDENNLEPGWEFLKELAQAGAIGRVASTESDFINSVNIGETSVSIANLSNWIKISENNETVTLTRESKPGFKTFIYSEGAVILNNSPNKEAAKKFLNFMIESENNQE
jgi:putative spermidine/putrescine transport system substrate-binding protein